MADLEQTLIDLNHYGEPTMHRMREGWWCTIDLFVQAAGAKVKIASESNHPLPSSAASECLERVEAVVHGISKLADNKAITHG